MKKSASVGGLRNEARKYANEKVRKRQKDYEWEMES